MDDSDRPSQRLTTATSRRNDPSQQQQQQFAQVERIVIEAPLSMKDEIRTLSDFGADSKNNERTERFVRMRDPLPIVTQVHSTTIICTRIMHSLLSREVSVARGHCEEES